MKDRTGILRCRCHILPTTWFKSVLPYFVISFSYKEIAQSFSSLTSRYSTRPSCKKSSKLLVKTKQKYHVYKRPRTKITKIVKPSVTKPWVERWPLKTSHGERTIFHAKLAKCFISQQTSIWACSDHVTCMVNITKDLCKFWINSAENGPSHRKEAISTLTSVISKTKVLERARWRIVEVFKNVKTLIFQFEGRHQGMTTTPPYVYEHLGN